MKSVCKFVGLPVFLVIILLVSAATPSVVAAETLLYSWEIASLSTKALFVDGSLVPIYYGSPIYYITNFYLSGCKYLIYIGVPDNVLNRLIQLNGRVYEAKFSSSAPKVASIDEYGLITFWSEGDVVFTVSIGAGSIEIPVQVMEGPWVIDILHDQITVEDVVRSMGFPEERTHAQIRWPERAAVLDNILYCFGGTSDITFEHWHYDQYPSLLFRVHNHRLMEIQNVGWDSYSSLQDRIGIP